VIALHADSKRGTPTGDALTGMETLPLPDGASIRLRAMTIDKTEQGWIAFDGWSAPAVTHAHFSDSASIPDGSFIALEVDATNRRLRFISDKFGCRSLYFGRTETHVYFADNLDFFSHIFPNLRVRTLGLLEWCHFGQGLLPHTMCEELKVLTPGHRLTVDLASGDFRQDVLFDPVDQLDPALYAENCRKPMEQLEKELDACFDRAIQKYVGAEKTISILLSGGVDSSFMSATTARHAKVNAITVDIIGGESEVPFARRVAGHIDADLTVSRFDKAAFQEYFVRTVHASSLPPIIENAVALFHVGAQGLLPNAGRILDGEGADALYFGSTPLFRTELARLVVADALRLSEPGLNRIVRRLSGPLGKLGFRYATSLQPAGVDLTLGMRMAEVEELTDRIEARLGHVRAGSEREIATITMREFFGYMLPLFSRLDAMARISSSMTGLPFLEEDFFRFSVNLPVRSKIGRKPWTAQPATKILLKRVAAKLVPPEVIYRPKVGFGIPGGEWIGAFPEAWRADSWVAETFGLARGALDAKLAHTAGKRDMMYYMGLEAWGRLFIRKQPLDMVDGEYRGAQR
jgi:asparagine synthase (glutamine-hydrolysing)